MPINNIPVVTKLTAESSVQAFDMGHAQRISVLDPTMPPHFPCHIMGTSEGLICSHGTDFVAIPWKVLRSVWESANTKLIAPPAPKNEAVKPLVDAAIAEAQKLPHSVAI